LISFPAVAQRLQGELDCKPTKTDFIYDCIVRLARNGQPLSGAQITVGADMPSMPMAHNVKPVKAKAGKAPGEYEAKLDLEMLGEWAVKLRLAAPVKDQLVLLYEFDEKGARPVRRGDRPPRK
jgi:YtkA-like